jgi:6-phosphogluconolactonase (cycloisomerase 2 family)
MATKKTAAKKPVLTDNQKISLGVGLTAAAVAAAGTFFLYGSKGASKNRKAVKSWVLKAKAEVLEKLETAKEMSADEYMQLIDTVGGAYAGLKEASKVDISTFKKEMKDHWNKIEKTAAPKKKAVKKAIKKVVDKVEKVIVKAEAKVAPAKKTTPKN